MKKLFFIITLSLVASFSFAQRIPLIIKGKLINCPEHELYLHLQIKSANSPADTIRVNKDGTFYLKTTKFDGSQKMAIGHHYTLINNLFFTQGDQITITGNAKNNDILRQTLKVTTESYGPVAMHQIQVDKNGDVIK